MRTKYVLFCKNGLGGYTLRTLMKFCKMSIRIVIDARLRKIYIIAIEVGFVEIIFEFIPTGKDILIEFLIFTSLFLLNINYN